MDENKEVLEGQVENETEVNGIKISDDVVAIIAGMAASEVKGVSSMNGGLVGGISEVFGKKNFAKGVKVQVGEKEVIIDLFITVEYGCRIPDIAWEIQNKVKTAVENMTGLSVVEVNIHVQGVNMPKEVKKEKVKEEPAEEGAEEQSAENEEAESAEAEDVAKEQDAE
ncbi:MAG: Asp23/Gls24 family envelope stress response protein [Clostridia bacterium]|nr:Asp23/Gls24 family envelope stress response protein [Clostridia bacterium]